MAGVVVQELDQRESPAPNANAGQAMVAQPVPEGPLGNVCRVAWFTALGRAGFDVPRECPVAAAVGYVGADRYGSGDGAAADCL